MAESEKHYRIYYYLTNQEYQKDTLNEELVLRTFDDDMAIKSKVYDETLEEDEYILEGTYYSSIGDVSIHSGAALTLSDGCSAGDIVAESGSSLVIQRGSSYGTITLEDNVSLFLGKSMTIRDLSFSGRSGGRKHVWYDGSGNIEEIGSYGGAVLSNAHTKFYDCLFTGNSSIVNGGAIASFYSLYPGPRFENYDISLLLDGCSFSSNSVSNYDGGAVYADGGNNTIKNCSFSNNSAGNYGGCGGAVALNNGTIDHSSFSNNRAVNGGAVGISFSQERIDVKDSTFEENEADNYGGAFYSVGPTFISNSTFTNNRADYGGGVSHAGTMEAALDDIISIELSVSGGAFENNEATYYGGGIYLANYESFGYPDEFMAVSAIGEVTNVTFANNSADIGGAIYTNGTMSIVNCRFSGNQANSYGGAIANFGSLSLTDTIFETDRDTVYNAGSITINGIVSSRAFWQMNHYGYGHVYNNGIFNWDISALTPGTFMTDYLNGYRGDGLYALTVLSPLEDGRYGIGMNASAFLSDVYILNELATTDNCDLAFIWDEERKHYNDVLLGGQYYWLTHENGNLVLFAGQGDRVKLYKDGELVRRGYWMEDVVMSIDSYDLMEIYAQGKVWNLEVGIGTNVVNQGGVVYDITVHGRVDSYANAVYEGITTIGGRFYSEGIVEVNGILNFELLDDVDYVMIDNFDNVRNYQEIRITDSSSDEYGKYACWGLFANAGNFSSDAVIKDETQEYKLWQFSDHRMLIRTKKQDLMLFQYSIPQSLNDLERFLYASKIWDWENISLSLSLPDLQLGIEDFGKTVNKRPWLRFSITSTSLSYEGSSGDVYKFRLQSSLNFSIGVLNLSADVAGDDYGLYCSFSPVTVTNGQSGTEIPTFKMVGWDLAGSISATLQQIDHRYKLFGHTYTVTGKVEINTIEKKLLISGSLYQTNRSTLTVTADFSKIFEEGVSLSVESEVKTWDYLQALEFRGQNCRYKLGASLTLYDVDLRWENINGVDYYSGSLGFMYQGYTITKTQAKAIDKLFGIQIAAGSAISVADIRFAGKISTQGNFSVTADVQLFSFRPVDGNAFSVIGTSGSMKVARDVGNPDTDLDDVIFVHGMINVGNFIKTQGSVIITEKETILTVNGELTPSGLFSWILPDKIAGGIIYKYENTGTSGIHWLTIWGYTEESGERTWYGSKYNLNTMNETKISSNMALTDEIGKIYDKIEQMDSAVAAFTNNSTRAMTLYSVYQGNTDDITVTIKHDEQLCFQLNLRDFKQQNGRSVLAENATLQANGLSFQVTEFSNTAFSVTVSGSNSGKWSISVGSQTAELSDVKFAAELDQKFVEELVLSVGQKNDTEINFSYTLSVNGSSEYNLYLCCDQNDNGFDGKVVAQLDLSGDYTLELTDNVWWSSDDAYYYLMLESDSIPEFSEYVCTSTQQSITFDLSEKNADCQPEFYNWSLIEGSENLPCSIVVTEDQAEGNYALALQAHNFSNSCTVRTADTILIEKISIGEKVAYNNKEYELLLDAQGELSFAVTKSCFSHPRSDINGNGVSDVLFQYTGGDNQLGFWLDGTDNWQGQGIPESADWDVIGAYDMSSDGKADVVMLGNVTVSGIRGTFVGYRKNGDMSSWENISYLTNAEGVDWQVKVGNLTGNEGKNSILWHAPDLGAVGVWTDGTDNWVSLGAGYDRNWEMIGAGDFDGDGADSILFSYANGAKYYALDLDQTATELGVSDSGWEVRAIGDFSGDGKDDIVAFNAATGLVAKWENGNSDSWSSLGQLDAADWFIAGAGDYNGDGTDDLLVRQNSTGMLGYYADADLSKWNEMGRGVDMNWAVIA